MPGYLLTALLFCMMCTTVAAQDPKTDKELLDSLLANDPLLRTLDSANSPTGYAVVSISAGNKIFSMRNNRLNTLQSEDKLVITPSIGYFHKSGFGITASANLLNDDGKYSFYQSSITGSFDYLRNKNFDAGLSFTRYFIRDRFSEATSPIQNDFYGYAVYRKPWLNPLLTLGYATGHINEITQRDTMMGPIRLKIIDTLKTSLHTFSLSAGAEHNFQWFGVMKSNDGMALRPQVLLNFGSEKYKTTHTGSTASFNPLTGRKTRFNRYNQSVEHSGLYFQSIALALSLQYAINNFYIRPFTYLDYYLPSTSEKRFTTVFNLAVGYNF